MVHTDSPLHTVRKLALTMFSGQLPAYTGRYQGETTAVNQLVIASFINTFSAPAICKTQEVKNAKSSKPNTLSLKTNKPNIHMHVHTHPHTYHITHPHISYGLLGAWEDFLNQTVLYRGCSQDPSSIIPSSCLAYTTVTVSLRASLKVFYINSQKFKRHLPD